MKLILSLQHHHDTKITKEHTNTHVYVCTHTETLKAKQNKKLHTDVPGKCRCDNSQQKTCNPNSAVH
jgi:hypothetical protein